MTDSATGPADPAPAPPRAAVETALFVLPNAEPRHGAVDMCLAAERAGFDYASIQDHPYQRRFYDTWTLISYAAARTDRLRFFPNVANLPLRQPAVLAKSAATLDQLTGGRVELGLGAGGFWDAIVAMGGPRRPPGEALGALREAIAVIRACWSEERTVKVAGEAYSLAGLHPGPRPAHAMGIWLGVYGPRALTLLGEAADGWSVSVDRIPPAELAGMHARIDDAAVAAGRDPATIRRIANIGVDALDDGLGDRLAEYALANRFDLLNLAAPNEPDELRRLGEEVLPRLREHLAG